MKLGVVGLAWWFLFECKRIQCHLVVFHYQLVITSGVRLFVRRMAFLRRNICLCGIRTVHFIIFAGRGTFVSRKVQMSGTYVFHLILV